MDAVAGLRREGGVGRDYSILVAFKRLNNFFLRPELRPDPQILKNIF